MFRRRRSISPAIVLFVIASFILGVLMLIDLTLRSAFYGIAEVRAIQLATEAIQKTLQQEMADESIQYQDFIRIDKDSQGHVALMQANTVKVNKIAASTTLAVQKKMEDLRWQTFDIPLGQILGVPLLANYGPRITYHVLPIGTVRVNILDDFESAGINQTRHKIYLSFDTNVRIVIPSKSGEAVVATKVPIAESIIVGSVPSTFVTVPYGIFGNGLVK